MDYNYAYLARKIMMFFSLEAVFMPLFLWFDLVLYIIYIVVQALVQYFSLVYLFILIGFLVSCIGVTYYLGKLFEFFKDQRLANATALMYIGIFMFLLAPFIPILNYYLIIWGLIFYFLVHGVLLFGLGSNFYEKKINILGLSMIIGAFTFISPLGTILIIVALILASFWLYSSINTFASKIEDPKAIQEIKKVLAELCDRKELIKINELGKKFIIPRSILISIINELINTGSISGRIISGYLLCGNKI